MIWRSLRTAAWLGWQIESNWASPWVFAIYAIVKPLTAAAILVVMFGIATSADYGSPAFAYMYIGNAFYMYVAAVMGGMAQAVVDDRERFRTLKSMYVAPVAFPMYLVGRGAARFATTTLSILITVVFGVVFLHLQVSPGGIHWTLLLAAGLLGLAMLSMMGLVLASIVLTIAHGSWLVGEAVAAALFLFCGAVFPIHVLPVYLQPAGYLMPVTYWLELVRRSLMGNVDDRLPTLVGVTTDELIAIVVTLTLGLGAVAAATFRRCDHVARERGLIDWTTNY